MIFIFIPLFLAINSLNATDCCSNDLIEEKINEAIESGIFLPFKPFVPKDFIFKPCVPNGKYELDHGVMWSTKENIENIWKQNQNNPKASFKANTGLIRAKLSFNVAQQTMQFSIDENALRQEFKKMNAKEIVFKRLTWGEYPVIAVSAKFSNRKPVAIAWMGLNQGPVIVIDYVFPDKPSSYEDDWLIWNNFLLQTKGVSPEEINKNMTEFGKSHGLNLSF